MGIEAIAESSLPFEGEWDEIAADAGKLIIASRASVPNHGRFNVAVLVDTCSFEEIARAMMTANTNKATLAFRKAMQDGHQQDACEPDGGTDTRPS